MPAKKKKAAPRKRNPPPPEAPVPVVAAQVPAPVLTVKQRRFWMSIQKKNLIGGTMFLLGLGFCIGFWISDRAHGIEKVVLGVGIFLIIFGAHFIDSDPTERALGAMARTAGKVIPLTRKSSNTAEQKATTGDSQ